MIHTGGFISWRNSGSCTEPDDAHAQLRHNFDSTQRHVDVTLLCGSKNAEHTFLSSSMPFRLFFSFYLGHHVKKF